MKKVIAVTLSLVFLWFVSNPQGVYADTNNKSNKKMNVCYKELAKILKNKFPEYSDIDDKTLAEKFIAKNPEYKDYVYFNLKTNPINVAFCFDENLWMQAGVAITSLLCTAEEKCCYNIYCVVPDSVNQTMRNILESLVKKRSPMSSIKFLTVTNQLDSVEDGTKRATCYRLLLPNLLPDVDKVIYTDIDVIFNYG